MKSTLKIEYERHLLSLTLQKKRLLSDNSGNDSELYQIEHKMFNLKENWKKHKVIDTRYKLGMLKLSDIL